MIEQAVGIDTATIEYFTMGKGKYGLSSLLNWQFMFVIGIIVVAFILGKHKLWPQLRSEPAAESELEGGLAKDSASHLSMLLL